MEMPAVAAVHSSLAAGTRPRVRRRPPSALGAAGTGDRGRPTLLRLTTARQSGHARAEQQRTWGVDPRSHKSLVPRRKYSTGPVAAATEAEGRRGGDNSA